VTSFIPDTSRRTLIGTQFETIITRQSQKLTQVQTTRETQSDEYTSVPGGFGYVNTRPIVNTEVNTNGYTSYDPLTQYVNIFTLLFGYLPKRHILNSDNSDKPQRVETLRLRQRLILLSKLHLTPVQLLTQHF